jgi:peptide/nickel transport system substrate-binding protein
MKHKYPVVLTITAVGMLLGGCGGGGAGSGSSGAPLSGGTFTMNLGTDPGTINPYKTTGGTNRQIIAFAYDTLIGRTPGGTIVPQLATRWQASPDQVTYTLRKGVTCQDGHTLTPGDVAADFNSVNDPKEPSPWIGFALPVPYTATADDTAGTVTIKTKKPFGFLLEGAGSLPIVCPAGLKKPDSIEHASNGTGPYKVTSYVPGDHYTLEARPGYAWGPNGATNSAAGTPKTVKIGFVQNESTSVNQILAGQINAVQITGPDRARLDANPSLKRFDVPVIVGELNPNEATGRMFADQQVRLAMAAALERQQVTKVGTANRGKVATELMVENPVVCPGDETTGTIPAYNPASANQILDAAGYAKGADGIRAKNGKKLVANLIYQVGAPQTVSAVELIGQQLKAVGIGTNLKGLTQAAFLEALYTTRDFDVFYSAINLEFPFMMTAYWGGPLPDKGGRNSGSVVNKDFDSLSAKAMAVPGKQSCGLWKQAHEAILKRADVIPISVGNRPYYTSKATLQTVGLFATPTSIRLYK